MVTRQRTLASLVLLSVLAVLVFASYLRFDQANTHLRSQIRDLQAVSRVVYYRVQKDAGPRFQLSGGERSIRLITHLALERSVAWPTHLYRAEPRYPYGLQLQLLNPDGTRQWTKTVYISSAVSKGSPKDGVWTQEAAFSETRTFVPADARTTQVDLPEDVPVNSSLQVRLLTPDTTFAMVRAYGLSSNDDQPSWLQNLAMSPKEKQELVQGITYLDWDEITQTQQRKRLGTQVSRLTAASDVRSPSKIVPLYLSDYRVLRTPKPQEDHNVFVSPWNQTFVVQGPKRLKLSLDFGPESIIEMKASPHLLHIQRIDEQGNRAQDLEVILPVEIAKNPQVDRFIDVPAGQHTLKISWETPELNPGSVADLRSRRNKIRVSHARDHSQRLRFTLRDTEDSSLDLASDNWHQAQLHQKPELDPIRWRSTYYYLSQDSSPIHFLVPGDQEPARMFKIRATDWDRDLQPATTKFLTFAFLDAQKQDIDQGRALISQDFDRDRWVTIQGTRKGQDTPEALTIGLGTEQVFSGIAPQGTRWIKLSANAPILVQVAARIPERPSYHLAPPSPEPDLERPFRHWIPMLASEHPTLEQKGWVIPVKSTRRPPSISSDDADVPTPKRWTSLSAIGRPALQRVLEESPYQETAFGLLREGREYGSLDELWRDCTRCWLELPPYRTHRVLDRPQDSSEAQALWITGLQSARCSQEIDGARETFVCPAHREKRTLQALSGGVHSFRWQSDAHRDRLWLNRSSVPVHGHDLADGPTLYAERTLTKLDAPGQSYWVRHTDQTSQYLNFRVYRPVHDTKVQTIPGQRPLTIEIELDAGTPARHSGKLFSHFTPSIKRTSLSPHATPELVFLDGDQSGPFQRFEVGFRIGRDIKSGRHRVRIRALGDEALWVRAFEQGRDSITANSTIYGQSDPVK